MYGRCNTGYRHTGRGMHMPFENFGANRRPKYNVPVNIEEKEDSYELTIYATGFDKDNIRLSVTEDVLYITGTKQQDESYKPNFVKQEFPVRTFERIISLNGQVYTTNIKARQENNVLIVTLPKNPEAQKPAQEINVD